LYPFEDRISTALWAGCGGGEISPNGGAPLLAVPPVKFQPDSSGVIIGSNIPKFMGSNLIENCV
jgi:hypothetical protein